MFEDFFESSSPADYAKELINTKNPDEKKEIVTEIKNRISDLKDRIKQISEKEKKKKISDETLRIVEEVLNYNEEAQKLFLIASKVDKEKSEPKHEESVAKSILKESKEKSDQSIPKWGQVSGDRFKFIKLKIN